MSALALVAQAASLSVEPATWYAGMRNPSLQLLVSGPGISQAEVRADGAAIDSIVRPDSPNYLFVYLNTRGVAPGTITLQVGKQKVRVPLLPRACKGEERHGFTNADVLYMLMPDRFCKSLSLRIAKNALRFPYTIDPSQPSLRHGGNLAGIRQHLDYFNDLGVTALWFTPVLENDMPEADGQSCYHGYATTDYYRVDPRFGTNDDYAQLIADAHQHGLKVVMDMIFNHCGYAHPWVADPPMRDWFNVPAGLQQTDGRPADGYLQTSYKLTPVLDPYAADVDRRETVDGWFVPSMPDLNQRNPHLMRYLIQNSMWWIETAGIDGIRMDTYPYADRDAMAQWQHELAQEYPNFNTVGETWVTEPAYTAAWQRDSRLTDTNSWLPTVMDFSFYDKVNQAKHEQTDAWWHGYNRIYNSLAYDYLYARPDNVLAFIENHDTDRFLPDTASAADVATLRQALALLLTMRRTPQLYYGTEVLMGGSKARTDGDVRRDFPALAFAPAGRTAQQQDLYQWLQRLLHWRQGNKTIIEGKQTQFIPQKGVYVLARHDASRTVLTIINGTSHPRRFLADRYAEVLKGRTAARDIPTDTAIDLATLVLPPHAAFVLEM